MLAWRWIIRQCSVNYYLATHEVSKIWQKGLANAEGDPFIDSKLGKDQLVQKVPVDVIQSFIDAKDPSKYVYVYADANIAEILNVFIPFLNMAKTSLQKNSEYWVNWCICQNSKLIDLEKFVNGSNVANIQGIGDKCFSEDIYGLFKILFTSINNIINIL